MTVTTSLALPQPAGMAITLTASATGGTDVQFQFWVYNAAATPAWSQLQTYSSLATYTWTPEAAGNYLLSITAQDVSTGTGVNTLLWYPVSSPPPITALSVAATPAAPQLPNTRVTLTASATGGLNVTYEFWVYNAAATPAWRQLQGYSTSASCVWIPAAQGTYLLSITAQDGSTGTGANTLLWYSVSGSSPPLTVSVTATPAAPQLPNTHVTLTASATGGTNVLYQFWLYNATVDPGMAPIASVFSHGNLRVDSHGAGQLSALHHRTGWSHRHGINTSLWYLVTGATPLTAVSVAATPAAPQLPNTHVTLTASATVGRM